MARHPLLDQINRLRRQRQSRRMAAGVGGLTAVTLGVAVAVMLADYFVRSPDRGLRWLAAGAVLASAGAACARWLAPVLQRPETPGGVAAALQRRFPTLGSRVASALEFLDQPAEDPRDGSSTLRRAVVAQAASEVERVEVSEVVDRYPARRGVAAAFFVTAVVGVFGLADPTGLQTAAARLVTPWRRVEWPRQHRLTVRDAPARIARGQTFRATVIDARGRALPEDLRVQYRAGDGSRIDEQPIFARGPSAEIDRQGVRRGFEFRVIGGDDQQMGWSAVEVVDPPGASVIAIRATPPAYSGIPAGPVAADVRVLRGTRLSIEATTTPDVTRAAVELTFGGSTRQIAAAVTQSNGEAAVSCPADLWAPKEGDAASAADPSPVTARGVYRLRLETDDGLIGFSQPRSLLLEPDTPPVVSWRTPASDLFVTAGAEIDLEAVATDNLATRWIEAVVTGPRGMPLSSGDGAPEDAQRSDEAPRTATPREPLRLRLYTADDTPPARPNGLASVPQQVAAAGRLDLAPLGLAEGDQLVLAIEASDYRPGVGRSASTRRVTIISSAELEERIAEAAAALSRDLARALDTQREARRGVKELSIEQRAGQPADRATADRLATLGYQQREVGDALADPARGAAQQSRELLKELRRNRVERPELEKQLAETARELEQLAAGPIAAAERSIADARRAAERTVAPTRGRGRRTPAENGGPLAPGEALDKALAKTKPRPAGEPPAADEPADRTGAANARQAGQRDLAEALARGEQQQNEAVEQLEKLADGLDRWSDLQRLAREVAELERLQRELADASRQQALKPPVRVAAAQERAAEQKLAAAQSELSRRFNRLQQAMNEEVQRGGERPSPASQPVADALAEAERRATAGKLRDAARQLARGQLSRGAEQQQQAADDLRDLLDTLRNRPPRDPERLAEQLRRAGERLAELRKQAREQANQPRPPTREDAKERERLAAQAGRLARRLDRLGAPEASDSTQQGQQQLSRSASQAGGDPEQSQQSAEQGEQKLAQAEQQLQDQLEQLEEDRIQSVLQQLASQIDRYVDEQRMLLEGATAGGVLPGERARRDRTGRLAAGQRELEDRIDAAAQQLVSRPVFGLALARASQEMTNAAGRLRNDDPGPKTQRKQFSALTRLRQVARALNNDPEDNQGDDGENPPGQPPPGQPGEQPPPPPVVVAELKMLRLMQQDLAARTRDFEADAAAGRLEPPEVEAASRSLSREQAELTDLVREMSTKLNESTPR